MTGATQPPATDLDLGRLTGWLEANLPGFQGPVTVSRLSGGQSNPTYRLDAPSGSYALRRKPFGPLLPSAHAVDREHRLISALHPTGFPVPAPLALCLDETVLGAIFYVMEFKVGRNYLNGQLPDLAPTERRATYEAMVDALARLHAYDPAELGLSDYGRPGNYFGRQVERWTKQYRAAQTDDLPVVDRLIDYLAATVPPQTRTSIIHGDYRIDNLIFAPAAPEVIAIIDWELSTLGDPLADFAYLAMNWSLPAGEAAGLDGVDFAATGIPPLDAVVDRYCSLTGRDGLPNLDWYFAYNLFRLMGIVQGIKRRVIDGNASGANAEKAAGRVLQLADAAWDYARRAGAPS
jgi:aminoglycoside phosphotransferase (APT) family kinase protein